MFSKEWPAPGVGSEIVLCDSIGFTPELANLLSKRVNEIGRN